MNERKEPMNKSKRIISILLAVTICMASYCGLGSGIRDKQVTPAEYAQSFIDAVAPEQDLQTAEIVEIYNEEDLLSGFCVSLTKDLAPHGYVVIRFQKDENGKTVPVVAEYSPEEGVENIYNEIVEDDRQELPKAARVMALSVQNKKMYSISPNEYSVPVQENGEIKYANFMSDKVSEQEFEAQKEARKQQKEQEQADKLDKAAAPALLNARSGSEIASSKVEAVDASASIPTSGEGHADSSVDNVAEIEYVAWPSNPVMDEDIFFDDLYPGLPFEIYTVPNYITTYASKKIILDHTASYCCTDVASANMMHYFSNQGYRNLFTSTDQTYLWFWNATMTPDKIYDYGEDGSALGQVAATAAYTAIENYLKNKGYTPMMYFHDNLKNETQMAHLRNEFLQGKPCYFEYGYWLGAAPGSARKEHVILGLGYIIGDGGTYLVVNDSWHSYIRYFNLYGFYSEITDLYGFSVKIAEQPSIK